MMNKSQDTIKSWFEIWDRGDVENLPLAEDFIHHSPYGTVKGKKAYMDLVESNKDKFLGNTITIEDELYEEHKGCVRYTITKDEFFMKVSEWLYVEHGLIKEIISYYNIEGDISEERKIDDYPQSER